jgi:hypothetical protein
MERDTPMFVHERAPDRPTAYTTGMAGTHCARLGRRPAISDCEDVLTWFELG